jgi:hypothetical protein
MNLDFLEQHQKGITAEDPSKMRRAISLVRETRRRAHQPSAGTSLGFADRNRATESLYIDILAL